MKVSWLVIGLVVIVIVVGVLMYMGIIPSIDWQHLTIIAASIFGPIKALFDSVGGKKKVDEILAKNALIREQDEEYQKEMEAKVLEQQKKLDELSKEIEVRNAKLEVLEEKKKRVAAETKALSVEQIQGEAKNLFGE